MDKKFMTAFVIVEIHQLFWGIILLREIAKAVDVCVKKHAVSVCLNLIFVMENCVPTDK